MARDPFVAPGERDFDEVIRAEIAELNRRRRRRGPVRFSRAKRRVTDLNYSDNRAVIEVAALALSGGGIRSAAFSLGVVQALNQHDVIRHIDYLSTVSGGGYMGASMTATMSHTGGDFAFGGNPTAAGSPPTADISDTDSVAQIRNYSNYLIPFGFRDVMTAIAIVARGLVANLSFVVPLMLIAAALTVLFNPVRSHLTTIEIPSWFGIGGVPAGNFVITLTLIPLALIFFLIWAIYRSHLAPDRLSEFRTRLPRVGAGVLLAVVFVFFWELQPVVIERMFEAYDEAARGARQAGGLLVSVANSWVQVVVMAAAPIWAAATFFHRQFSNAIEAGSTASKLRTRILGVAARAGVVVAGLFLPVLIWAGVLYLAFWGIGDDTSATPYAHAPAFLSAVWTALHDGGLTWPHPASTGAIWVYTLFGLVLYAFSSDLAPNANSLHRLYRDRISKAFLFDPDKRMDGDDPSVERDLDPLDQFKLSELSAADAPYHLICATLNLQGSDFANRRGRNGDFFLFSREFIGSAATGYEPTAKMQQLVPDLDLATAVAVSGAAASSNMGALSIKPLTPTLALLNIRLGYWMKNPYVIHQQTDPLVPRRTPYFLWAEITGNLDEKKPAIYVTDGGHIENLGIYELLRRKCRLIISVDCDTDAEMRYPSLMAVQRHARIDLGIRINLPWQAVAEIARGWMGAGSASNPAPALKPTVGPHIAVGKIDYGEGESGYLVYVKPSLTGDENDYIRDYARRYDSYPHETTGDQFFGEEQFEVYRALGFHEVFGFLDGRDDVVIHTGLIPPAAPAAAAAAGAAAPAPPPRPTPWENARIVSARDPALKPVRDLLGV